MHNPILAALRAGMNVQLITADDRGPYRATPDNCLVMIYDDGDAGPLKFNVASLRALIESAACVVLNSGPDNVQADALLVDGARLGKSIIIQTGTNHAADWMDYIQSHKRKDCGFFAILPERHVLN